MNFFLEFDRKEVGTYVKKYLLTNHTACLRYHYSFPSVNTKTRHYLMRIQPVQNEYNAFIAGRLAQCKGARKGTRIW